MKLGGREATPQAETEMGHIACDAVLFRRRSSPYKAMWNFFVEIVEILWPCPRAVLLRTCLLFSINNNNNSRVLRWLPHAQFNAYQNAPLRGSVCSVTLKSTRPSRCSPPG